jgi:uncharacterized protein YbjT (DUF2867 family)
MILVTTAGQVGSEAARLLAQRGELVRVLVRDRDKSAALAQAGVDVAKTSSFEQFATDYPQAVS